MTIIIVIIAFGIIIGFLLRNNELLLKINDKLLLYAIFVLLFFLGFQIGNNREIISNLSSIGFKAFIISSGSIAGSVVVVFFFNKYFNHWRKK